MLKLALLVLSVIIKAAVVAKWPMTIYVDSPNYIGGAGMFHNFNIVLGCLDIYDTHDYVAIKVDFGTKGLYYDASYGSNWWNYYFEPIDYPVRSLEYGQKRPMVKYLNDLAKADFGNNAHFCMKRERAHELIKRYIRVRQELLDEVETFYQKHLEDCFILGVHYRGTDKWAEATYITDEEILLRILKEEKKNSGKVKIFLATDCSSFLEKMQRQFGDQVCFIQAERFETEPVHYHAKEKFSMGKEAVMECLLLAKSDLLIRMNSNLSAVAAYFNPHMKVINLNTVNDSLYQDILKRGIPNELNLRY
jgi:hypothetical protein